MPDFQVKDTVYAIRLVAEGPNDHSPGGVFCWFGDKLIIKEARKTRTVGGHMEYVVTHEDRQAECGFYVRSHEISHMRHFPHNVPTSWLPYRDRPKDDRSFYL
jgi:hypothetical protein